MRPKCAAERTRADLARRSVALAAPIGSKIMLSDVTRDKYGGRVVASVTTPDGNLLAMRLLAENVAVPDAAAKPWCLS